jgi:hypothetical protein
MGFDSIGNTPYVLISAGRGCSTLEVLAGHGTGIHVPQSGHSSFVPNWLRAAPSRVRHTEQVTVTYCGAESVPS